MKKLLSTFGLFFTLAFTLTGCELYFGKSGNGGSGDGSPPGWECESDKDCAAGCYCEGASEGKAGECAEAGFCDSNADCPDGYVCDDRSSCVPDEGPTTCVTDADCKAGAYCADDGNAADGGVCTTSCVCEDDAQAVAGGFHHCDEARKTCMPGNPLGTCNAAELTCNLGAPACGPGTVPIIAGGCYNGACSPINQCDVEPACPAFQHESDCMNPDDELNCQASYTGLNCTTSNGSSCTPNTSDTQCMCESYVFAACR